MNTDMRVSHVNYTSNYYYFEGEHQMTDTEKQTEVLRQIAEIASDNGLIITPFSLHSDDTFYEVEGDYEEGDYDLEHIDRISITRKGE